MIRIKYSLVFFTILNYQCSTNCEKEMESNSLEYTKNEYQIDLNNLSLLDPLIERNFKNCYIAAVTAEFKPGIRRLQFLKLQ
jgi:hypothetical protein